MNKLREDILFTLTGDSYSKNSTAVEQAGDLENVFKAAMLELIGDNDTEEETKSVCIAVKAGYNLAKDQIRNQVDRL